MKFLRPKNDGARYYSPNIGRFLSEDPIGFRGGINKYAYALGSPTNLVSPSGNNAFVPAIGGEELAAWAGSQLIPGVGEAVDAALLVGSAVAVASAINNAIDNAQAASPDPGRKPEGNCCFAAGTPVLTVTFSIEEQHAFTILFRSASIAFHGYPPARSTCPLGKSLGLA